LTGSDGITFLSGYNGKGGTQTAAGVNASCDTPQDTNGFQGALIGGSSLINSYGGAGGGGYWGGSAGGYSTAGVMGGGGGGSGYLNRNQFLYSTLYSGSGTTPGNSFDSLRFSSGNSGGTAVNGNNGLVYFKYKGTQRATGGAINSVDGYTYHNFSSSGSITFNPTT
jgi:hypothetical protein